MPLSSEAEAATYIFRSLRRLRGSVRGFDETSRDVSTTLDLLKAADLMATSREYAVVTGSKGKGSTTAIMAKLLQHLGHTVGMVTSPHLVSWRERIRINGRAIPEYDFVRITNLLAPYIDVIEDKLASRDYLSPTGIFLAIALRWFNEQGVNAAVLEVGRGGRFDDMSVVPNKLAVFTPIMLEHTKYLGDALERIAWHKAGIIKAGGYAYSVSQAPEVLDVMQAEADAKDATFSWIMPMDMGQYVGPSENGIRFTLGRYGELTLSMLGQYEIENASLAVTAVGNLHARLPGMAHGSPEYSAAIRDGLADVNWPGRCQKLRDHPAVYIDAAINQNSAEWLVKSLQDKLTDPVISVICVPDDKDFLGVFEVMGRISQSMILTETSRNPILHFLPRESAVRAAEFYCDDVTYIDTVYRAVERAMHRAGTDGTVIMVGTISMLADAMAMWGTSYEEI